jgi:hypothetical protein
MVWAIVIPVVVIVVIPAVIYLIGSRLPVKHTVTVRAQIKAQPGDVWAIITDFPGQVTWRKGLKKVERTADKNSHEVWLEEAKREGKLILETTVAERPKKLVRRIANEKSPFGGNWTIDLEQAGFGTLVVVTENGEVYNPVFRFVSRFIMDQSGTIRKYLAELEAHVDKMNAEKQ